MCLCIAMILCFLACNSNLQDSEEYFYEINNLIKDENFNIAKAYTGKIVLYDVQQNPIKEIPFDKYDKNINFKYAWKEGPVVFFVTNGAVDDEQGVLFINDNSNDILEGINSIKRIGGNSYVYDTAD